MPHRVEQRCRTAAHAALRAGFHRCLEMFVERNTAGMERFTTANRATQRTNTPGVDADPARWETYFTIALEVALMESRLSPHSISTQELN